MKMGGLGTKSREMTQNRAFKVVNYDVVEVRAIHILQVNQSARLAYSAMRCRLLGTPVSDCQTLKAVFYCFSQSRKAAHRNRQ